MKLIPLLSVSLLCFIGPMNASEELELDTEELKSKEDNYSSLTDINGIALFSDDMSAIVLKQENILVQNQNAIREVIFTGSVDSKDLDKFVMNSLFDSTVQMSKVSGVREDTDEYILLLIIITLFLSGGAFIGTNSYYKRKRRNNDENNSYLY